MWKKSTALLIAMLLLTQVCAFADYSESFETGYTLDSALNGVNGWEAGSGFQVLTDPVNAENGKIACMNSGTGSATKSFEPASGNIVDISFRFLLEGSSKDGKSAGNLFSIRDGDKVIATLANVALHASPGNYAGGEKASGSCPSVLVMAANNTFPTNNLGYVTANDFYKMSEWVWVTDNGKEIRQGGTPTKVWFYVRMKVDFSDQTVDTYISRTQAVTDDMIANNTDLYGTALDIPFIDKTADKVDTFIVNRPSGDNSTALGFDDLFVKGETAPASDVTVECIGASAQQTDDTATLRFSSQVIGDGADSVGAVVLPLWLFNEDQDISEVPSAETVTINNAVADGETFGVDVTEIPYDQFDTDILAKPFAFVDGAVVWGETFESSVNKELSVGE
jgi:hypothetical protein